MSVKRVRRGRVQGYQPSRQQFEDLMELAQRGIDDPVKSILKHEKGDAEVDSDGVGAKLTAKNLDEIYEGSDRPDVLNNLHFSVTQESPVRRIDLQIGQGGWTTYVIESDDATWCYGRYHEITEKLLHDRNWFAKSRTPAPYVPQEGSDSKWRRTFWEHKYSLIETYGDTWISLLWFGVILEILGFGFILLDYYDPNNGGNETAAKARSDKIGALHALQWAGHHAGILVLINVFYIPLILFAARCMRPLVQSKVIFKGNTLLKSLSFGGSSDTVALAGLYLTFLALIVAILALFI